MKDLNVNLETLALPSGDGEAPVTPGVGDNVQVMVEGVLSKIEGGRAHVTPVMVNGEPVDNAGDDDLPKLSEEEQLAAEEAEFSAMADEDWA